MDKYKLVITGYVTPTQLDKVHVSIKVEKPLVRSILEQAIASALDSVDSMAIHLTIEITSCE